MDISHATSAFAALSQPTRLAAFQLLIRAGDNGMAAGDIAASMDVRQNTMSSHLATLTQAGLIRNERQGRTIRYFADLDGVGALLSFLIQDCCGGHPEQCRPMIAALGLSRAHGGPGKTVFPE